MICPTRRAHAQRREPPPQGATLKYHSLQQPPPNMEASLTAEGPAIKLTPVEMLKDGVRSSGSACRLTHRSLADAAAPMLSQWATFKRDLDSLMTSPRDLAFLYICGFGTAFTYNTMANVRPCLLMIPLRRG